MKSLLLVLLIGLIMCAKTIIYAPHHCKLNCPYKGIVEYNAKVAEYEPGTDGYIIDSLHIAHPSMNYDELEDLLFKLQ